MNINVFNLMFLTFYAHYCHQNDDFIKISMNNI